MNELSQDDARNKLAELIFDLEKFTPTMNSAQDCVTRLKQNWINTHIQSLREELKTVESTGKNPIPLMREIEKLQKQSKNSSYHEALDE